MALVSTTTPDDVTTTPVDATTSLMASQIALTSSMSPADVAEMTPEDGATPEVLRFGRRFAAAALEEEEEEEVVETPSVTSGRTAKRLPGVSLISSSGCLIEG